MSHSMKLVIQILASALVTLGAAASASAGSVQLVSRTELSPSDLTAIYPEPNGTLLPAPYVLNTGDNVLTFTLAGGAPKRLDVGLPGWITPFPAGLTRLLFTNNTPGGGTPPFTPGTGGGGSGPITIDFAAGVGELGLFANNRYGLTQTFTFTAYNGGATLGTFSVMSQFNTQPLFLGVRATAGDVITRLVVSGMSGTGFNNDFVISPVIYGTASPVTVPEPATILLLGAGLAGVGAAAGKRRKAKIG